jgi:hypothetical protein
LFLLNNQVYSAILKWADRRGMGNQTIPWGADLSSVRHEPSRQRTRHSSTVTFMRGGHLFQIARSPDGRGYIGYRGGRVVGRGAERGELARHLLSFAVDQEVA